MKKKISLLSLSQILSLSVTVVAIQTQGDERSDDPFAQVFEGSGQEDDVISDTGQYKFVGSLFPKKPIMPNSEVVSGAAKGWKSIKGNTLYIHSLKYHSCSFFFQSPFLIHGSLLNQEIGLIEEPKFLKWEREKRSSFHLLTAKPAYLLLGRA